MLYRTAAGRGKALRERLSGSITYRTRAANATPPRVIQTLLLRFFLLPLAGGLAPCGEQAESFMLSCLLAGDSDRYSGDLGCPSSHQPGCRRGSQSSSSSSMASIG